MRAIVKDIVHGIADGLSILEEAVGPLALALALIVASLSAFVVLR